MSVLPEPAVQSETPPEYLSNLGTFVRRQFEKNRDARITAERRMLDDIRQKQGEYSPAKLALIQQVMGPGVDPPFIGLTGARCTAIYAWLVDAILPVGQPPFSVEPTPVPELPEFVVAKIKTAVENQVLDRVDAMAAQGVFVNKATLQAAYAEMMEAAKAEIAKEILEAARESALELFNEIKDHFVEGDWEQALRQSLHDLVDVGTAIMRGPTLRSTPLRKRALDEATGKFVTVFTHEVIPIWERLVPVRFYPSPSATRHSLPNWVYINSSSRRDLSSLLGDDSYDQKAVRLALRDYQNGHREITAVENEKALLEQRTTGLETTGDIIDRLEYGGSIQGRLLTEFGIEGLDPDMEYSALVWQVGKYVIKAILNPEAVGLNMIFSAGFSEEPDSFWGKSVPRLVIHSQNIANIAARGLVQNVAIASGPMVEANMDRAWPGETFAIRPWGVLKSTNSMMSEQPALKFYQPNMYSDKLMSIITFCEGLADQESGIPRLLYSGESSSPTASATSMLTSNAAKGALAVVKNVDAGIIVPCVMAQHQFILQYDESDREFFGDFHILARGTSSSVAKEQKVLRIKEILQGSANQFDAQTITPDIRMRLWKQAVEALGLDPELLGKEDEIDEKAAQAQAMMQQQQMMQMMGDGSSGTMRDAPGSMMLNPGTGEQQGGQDNRMMTSQPGSRP